MTEIIKPVGLNEIHKFFKGESVYPLKQFREEWQTLSDKDKAEIKAGFDNDTYTY